MPQGRGRALSPIRPGLVIKGVLMGKIPLLPTGEIVREACMSDLSHTYSELIKMENQSRPKSKRLRGMTWHSFATYFKFIQLLGLVEFVREEPMKFPPPGGDLLSIRIIEGTPTVVVSMRRIFRLSSIGEKDERSWTNPCRAWMEKWPAPQPITYALPYTPPVVAPPLKVEKVKPEKKPWVPFKRTARASVRQLDFLVKHLEKLADAGIKAPGVKREVDRLASMLVDWGVEAEDDIVKAKKGRKPKAAKYYEALYGLCQELEKAFIAQDIKGASKIVERMKELKE